MICPRDSAELKMASRQGVEFDFCPQCQGVWLDRGELEKLVEAALRENAAYSPQPAPGFPPPNASGPGYSYAPPPPGYHSPPPNYYPEHHEEYNRGGHHGGYSSPYSGGGHHGKRRSFLHDVFDL